jgi:8-oxo-dGTP pyrophosphatase MutT (NUDIX family)
MARKYEVYILNRPVWFSDKPTDAEVGWVFRNPDAATLADLPNWLRARPSLERVEFVADDVEALWIRFCMSYNEVLAAGCVVENRSGQQLWIERNGRWDLPKGKVEPGESIESAAIREVEEETGIGQLSLVESLGPTYHTYEMNGVACLKTTFWFKAFHDGEDTAGAPQAEEGITQVAWLPPETPPEVLKATFPSLRVLLADLHSRPADSESAQDSF